jgi:hypothetical protein
LQTFLLVFLIKKAERLTGGEKVSAFLIIWSAFLHLLSSIKLLFIGCTVASQQSSTNLQKAEEISSNFQDK